jgi:hypothetical protein
MPKCTLENCRFTENLQFNDGGSVFLGYLDADVVVPDALGEAADMRISLHDLRVRLTADDQLPAVSPASREFTNRDGEKRRRAHYWVDGATHQWIVAQVFNLPAVIRAYERAHRMCDEKKDES